MYKNINGFILLTGLLRLMKVPEFSWLSNPAGLVTAFGILETFLFKTELLFNTDLDVFNEEFTFGAIDMFVEFKLKIIRHFTLQYKIM